jgi:3-isopropylmalate/(R)-2-methylmalate dehydratase small subunit
MADAMNGLFLRNAINLGLPALSIPGVSSAFEELDIAEVNLGAGRVTNLRTGQQLHFPPLPDVLLEILKHGGLMAVMLERGYIDPPERGLTHAGS